MARKPTLPPCSTPDCRGGGGYAVAGVLCCSACFPELNRRYTQHGGRDAALAGEPLPDWNQPAAPEQLL